MCYVDKFGDATKAAEKADYVLLMMGGDYTTEHESHDPVNI